MTYDVIVIGGGSAGLMAAAAASGEGAKVILLEKEINSGVSWGSLVEAVAMSRMPKSWTNSFGTFPAMADFCTVHWRLSAIGISSPFLNSWV